MVQINYVHQNAHLSLDLCPFFFGPRLALGLGVILPTFALVPLSGPALSGTGPQSVGAYFLFLSSTFTKSGQLSVPYVPYILECPYSAHLVKAWQISHLGLKFLEGPHSWSIISKVE